MSHLCLQNAEEPLCFAVGEEMKIDELENREYPPALKAAQVFVTGGTILIFFAVLYWTLQAWAAFLSIFGTYKVKHLLSVTQPTPLQLPQRAQQHLQSLTYAVYRARQVLSLQAGVSALMSVWASVSIALAFKRVHLPLKTPNLNSASSRTIANGIK